MRSGRRELDRFTLPEPEPTCRIAPVAADTGLDRIARVLNIVLFACVALGDPRPPLPARLEVLEGRVSIATAAGVSEVRGPKRAQTLSGSVFVEIGPLARVHVDWDATASFEVNGPATLEWSPPGSDNASLSLRVVEAQELHLEVRRGPFALALPGDRRAEIERGAVCVRSVAGGTLELFHDAGLPLLLSTRTAERIVWPPVTLLPGAHLRLIEGRLQPVPAAGSERRVLDLYGRAESVAWERTRSAARWSGFSWPWPAPGAAN
jgi:hypothetical protein